MKGNKVELIEKLATIQQELNAPKGQFNSFGKYSYRNCEDILQALKPLLGECIILLNDDMVMVGDRFYTKSTATLSGHGSTISTTAFARESLTKKGMDDAQITGSCSSYARKYALNGLFLIDDNKDPDYEKNKTTGLDNIHNEIKAAIKGEDYQKVGELCGTFALHEEYQEVWGRLASAQRTAISKFVKSDEYEKKEQDKVEYLQGLELANFLERFK